ncbi:MULTISPECIES: CpaE family protein [unclassified Ornithinimicrobium]|uniref:AAA family ATPase n=1 Tax=unclassified Ornithinimicrobium TaxID=2615080 RepID=UPI003851F089
MTLPLVTAVAPRWEAELAGDLARSDRVMVVRRCADVAELVGVVAAGLGRLVVVSSDLRGLDRAVVETLASHDVQVLGVHPPGDEAAARTLLRWGVPVVVPADAGASGLAGALAELLDRLDHPDPDPDSGARAGLGGEVAGELDAAAGPPGSAGAVSLHAFPGREDQDRAGGRAHGIPGRGHGTTDPGRPGGDGEEAPAGPASGDPPERGRGQVLVVWGPTGSPGRTTTAVNLAAELADPLHPVVLVDADTYGASVAQTLAVLDEVPGVLAAARAADHGTLDTDQLATLAPEVMPGLRVLTGLPRADRWTELRDVALADVLEQCRQLGRWVVVDVAAPLEQDEELSFDTLAPRRNGAALTALEQADRVVVVGSGDPIALQRLVRGLEELATATVAPRTVVVTRVRPGPVGPEPGRRIQESLDRFASTGPVHLVPEDQDALDAALLHGRALREVRPRSPARLALAALADVLGEREPRTRRSTSTPWLRRGRWAG